MKRTDIKPIGQVIREHLQRLDESGKLSETIALTAVDDVLGKEFASLIKDRRIENGVLFLKTDSAAMRSELFASRSQLMQKLNEKTGKDVIKDVRIN
jgi:predicted nucleic acid-binding Zn ribbon protein